MNLLRALYSEQLKLKRTVSIPMMFLAPALIVALMFIHLYFQLPHLTLKGWPLLERPVLSLWAVAIMPLYIALETALISGLDHSGNQWKSLLARPVPRWTLYVAKLMIVGLMTAISSTVLLFGILVVGAILPRLRSDLLFGFPAPLNTMIRECAQVTGLCFLALTIQHWVSLRWRSFSVAVGVGIMATIVGGFAFAVGQQTNSWLEYFPWALPMLPLAERPNNHLGLILLIATIGGLVIVAFGCWDFWRREVS